MVAVAQLAERLVVVQEVAGSSPVSHPLRPRLIPGFYFMCGGELRMSFNWLVISCHNYLPVYTRVYLAPLLL